MGNVLIEWIEVEVIATLALLIVYLLLKILLMLRKIVLVPLVTVQTDKPEYARGETAHISGKVTENGEPAANIPVAIKVTDPKDVETDLGPVNTDATGAYTVDFPIDPAAAGGTYTVEADSLGVTATTSFTLSMRICEICGREDNTFSCVRHASEIFAMTTWPERILSRASSAFGESSEKPGSHER